MSSIDFVKSLGKTREISITVTGRKSGRSITLPVWFAKDNRRLFLLPVRGSRTNWFRNLRKNPQILVTAGDHKISPRARLIEDSKRTNQIAAMFRDVYGPSEVKKYYTVFDVSVEIPIA